ncbi:peptidase [Stappia sp. GBMRC 2046]|uniref:Peptidase n=1 Tax=Stappia sediminis TaxID=2692190 RepID=A0A7X3S9D4_9HYPH|nr:imelysin family protein [Stappia sediminis]MXN66645.1 peptidase [Stappia sediminis]
MRLKATLIASAAILVATPAFAHDGEVHAGDVLTTYADIAEAAYRDSLDTAETMARAVDALLAAPTEENLAAARDAWKAARRPYQQTEVFRFGNAFVDDWEGKVNSWPLDEGLIDYVADTYGSESPENPFYTANVVANASLTLGGETIDARTITPALLSGKLQEAGEIEANVATGYHAIEFLLWGQDLNFTDAGAGARPASDFDPANCTGGNCDRRAQYLKAATDLLLADLKEMADAWQPEGAARKELAEKGEGGGVATILTGMGSLSYGELAGERMKLGLLLHDPEEEHDCFSDNTHMSHLDDVLGIQNVWLGRYEGPDGDLTKGASLRDLVAAKDPGLAKEVTAKIETTVEKALAMKARAETTEAYDQMIGEGNDEGNAVVQAVIDGLVDQTRAIERAVAALELDGIAFEGSDSLDNVDAVFQ